MKGRGSFSNTSDTVHQHKRHNHNNDKRQEKETDSRLQYVLTILDIAELYNIFISHKISFFDMLLLEKVDMIELQLELYQRNRIWNFSLFYKKYAKNYSIEEIDDFFAFNRQFIFIKRNLDDSNGNENKDQQDLESGDDEMHSRAKQFSQSSELSQNNNEQKPKSIFSQKPINDQKKKQLPKQKITLSTSKEDVHDEIIEERKSNETNPNIHQSILEDYNMNKLLTEENQYNNYNTMITNKRNHKKNELMQNKKTLVSYNAYKNYANIKQDADDILFRLSKLKEEGELKKNKYKSLLQKIDKTSNNDASSSSKTNDNKDYHFKRMMLRIDQASEMKMSFNAYEQLNQIKEFIDIKGKQIKLSDMQLVNRELDVLFNSLQNSEEANHNKEGNANEGEEKVNEVEEVEEEYEADEGN